MIGKIILTGGLLLNTRRPPGALCALQDRKLRAMVAHAYRNVPYYRRLFDSVGLKPEQVRSLEDLEKIPPSSKADLRASDGLVAENAAQHAIMATTSGSTGHPFAVWLTPKDIATRRALDLRAAIGAGVRPFDRIAVISGRPHVSIGLRQRVFFRMDRVSPHDPLEAQLDQLRALRPAVLWTAPSNVRALLELTDYRLPELCGIRKIVTTAETADDSLRQRVEQLHGIRWHNFYGSIETGRIAWQCTHGTDLHLNSDHLVLEIEPLAGPRAEVDRGFGTVLVTTLNQRAMPFIRYRLGDLCAFAEESTCACGCRLPQIKAPIGRTDAVVALPSGRSMSPRDLMPIARAHRGVLAFQFIQEASGKLTVLLELGDNAEPDVGARILERVRAQLGEPLEIEVRTVDRIERTTEKLVDFISRVPRHGKASDSSATSV